MIKNKDQKKLAEYYVYNSEGDIARSVDASSLKDAQNKMNDLIKKDGSYWHQDGWRTVQDDKGNSLNLKMR